MNLRGANLLSANFLNGQILAMLKSLNGQNLERQILKEQILNGAPKGANLEGTILKAAKT